MGLQVKRHSRSLSYAKVKFKDKIIKNFKSVIQVTVKPVLGLYCA